MKFFSEHKSEFQDFFKLVYIKYYLWILNGNFILLIDITDAGPYVTKSIIIIFRFFKMRSINFLHRLSIIYIIILKRLLNNWKINISRSFCSKKSQLWKSRVLRKCSLKLSHLDRYFSTSFIILNTHTSESSEKSNTKLNNLNW